ncbi:TadE/TadG family type IV pilus assembly protein [Streptomyces sp. NPDC058256]|uniref:TadE/TadG family type IV pilus assembly protein n=1 Tax=Streptomyces sp. NPDC058256 TaxID=3346408 RepID=UPI0036F0E628
MTRRWLDAGSATVELVLLIPVLILMLWFLVYCGRMTDSRLRIEDAAHQAARAASSERTASAATAQARTTAFEALSDAGVTCQSLTVETSGSMQPGGTVKATITCHVDLSDLGLLQVPGTADLSADFSSPIDTYRGNAIVSTSGGGATP